MLIRRWVTSCEPKLQPLQRTATRFGQSFCMASDVEAIFGELGLSQYLDAFVEQGFDEWDIILDIQESDLDVLGVKLGHRRKLQRRIANARGVSPSASLVSPARSAVEDAKPEPPQVELSRPEGTHEAAGVAKRKYRRHPKPDENAPERPPSAYVLFSNKMREDLKSQNLSFTEIAKLVGENWQTLGAAEKEAYENRANTDKEKYHRDLIEYKKTPEYKKYIQYIHEFKDKQAKQSQVSDASKRLKLEPARTRSGGSSSNTATPGINTPSGSGSGSGSERFQGSEPPPGRKERMNSITSIAESQHSATPTMLSQANSNDDSMSSPRGSHYDAVSPHEPPRYHSHRPPSWRESGRGGEHLPSLSVMLDDGRKAMVENAGGDSNTYSTGFVAANHPRLVPEVLTGVSPTTTARVPLLRHDQSSNSSAGSTSPAMSIARTPGEGSLPIHALLSHQIVSAPVLVTPVTFDRVPPILGAATPSPTDPMRPPFGHNNVGHNSVGHNASHHAPHTVGPRAHGTPPSRCTDFVEESS
ncbi:hypothetical protein EDB81DRAFT_176267 [Dactylonectria macrodidyma]|uniref:HMG box domain-containing protein n=1 Tax=Dactylonectria macrodidyma TaxID=307937 RepID=A0A9P9FRZ8_9HYPO|nr:hypothetical protein EDB81DRAFT_176267 [Dactylonectria macrodidyma]